MSVKNLQVKKASGIFEPFDRKKLKRSLVRAGATKDVADRVIDRVEKDIRNNTSTQEIQSKIHSYLVEENSALATRYNLKRAILDLGPSGYPFEKFIAGLLDVDGYRVQVGQQVKGKCVTHEIDVIAKKNKRRLVLECKFHGRRGAKSDLKEALYTYARFLDVRAHFDEGWLVTNTKVTSEALDYTKCVGIKVLSWDYPEGSSLRERIEGSGLHPVTCLTTISKAAKQELLTADIVFCKDLWKREAGSILRNKYDIVKEEAVKVCRLVSS